MHAYFGVNIGLSHSEEKDYVRHEMQHCAPQKYVQKNKTNHPTTRTHTLACFYHVTMLHSCLIPRHVVHLGSTCVKNATCSTLDMKGFFNRERERELLYLGNSICY